LIANFPFKSGYCYINHALEGGVWFLLIFSIKVIGKYSILEIIPKLENTFLRFLMSSRLIAPERGVIVK
jgi:hypothetical protein